VAFLLWAVTAVCRQESGRQARLWALWALVREVRPARDRLALSNNCPRAPIHAQPAETSHSSQGLRCQLANHALPQNFRNCFNSSRRMEWARLLPALSSLCTFEVDLQLRCSICGAQAACNGTALASTKYTLCDASKHSHDTWKIMTASIPVFLDLEASTFFWMELL
jgi:hypothetical protein